VKSKRYSRRVITSICLIGVIAVAANWIYRYEDVRSQRIGSGTISIVDATAPSLPWVQRSVGGWPFKYYVANYYGNEEKVAAFSWLHLLGNFFTWSVIVLLVYIYEGRYHARTEVQTGKRGIRLRLSDLLLLTTCLAAVLGYYRFLENQAKINQQNASMIAASGGSSELTTSLPMPIGMLLPPQIQHVFSRITSISLFHPDDQTVRWAARLPNLTSLRIGGDGYSLDHIRPALSNPMLLDLRISGRMLEPSDLEVIATAKHLHVLSLVRTNVTAVGLHALGKMPHLFRLNLIDTPVRLDVSKLPECLQMVRALQLPHTEGEQQPLELANLPNLRELTINSYDSRLNRVPYQVHLKGLSDLTELYLDAMQKFDLKLDDLPSLESIGVLAQQSQERASPTERVPANPWLRRLHITKVPKIKELVLHTEDLDQFLFDDLSDTKVVLSREVQSNSLIKSNSIFQASPRQPYSKQETLEKTPWVEDIGKGGPVGWLDFWRYDVIRSISIAGLKNNSKIRRLNFAGSGVQMDQLTTLMGMHGLEELIVDQSSAVNSNVNTGPRPNIFTGPMQQESSDESSALRLSEFLRGFSNLRVLEAWQLSNVISLDLVDFPRLQVLTDSRVPITVHRNVKLIKMNRLRESLHFASGIEKVHLDGVESLRGISSMGPLPRDTVIGGLRDLKHFAVGGGSMNDAIFDEVLECKSLKKLTLAYTSVTSERLARIGELKSLEQLAVTGPQVTDEVVSNWSDLTQLTSLRLDDTAITAKSLDFILAQTKLDTLSINRTSIDASVITKLRTLKRLGVVGLAGMKLSTDDMTELCRIKGLEKLDLSGCVLSAETLAPLIKDTPLPLVELRLANCQLDSPSISKLGQDHASLSFDLSGSNVDSKAMLILQFQTIQATGPQSGRRVVQGPNGPAVRVSGRMTEALPIGELDPSIFRDMSQPTNK
jgi:Leucine-rich repeat (LRR) protein